VEHTHFGTFEFANRIRPFVDIAGLVLSRCATAWADHAYPPRGDTLVWSVGQDAAHGAPGAIDVEPGWAYALPVRRAHQYNPHSAQTVPQRCSDAVPARACRLCGAPQYKPCYPKCSGLGMSPPRGSFTWALPIASSCLIRS